MSVERGSMRAMRSIANVGRAAENMDAKYRQNGEKASCWSGISRRQQQGRAVRKSEFGWEARMDLSEVVAHHATGTLKWRPRKRGDARESTHQQRAAE